MIKPDVKYARSDDPIYVTEEFINGMKQFSVVKKITPPCVVLVSFWAEKRGTEHLEIIDVKDNSKDLIVTVTDYGEGILLKLSKGCVVLDANEELIEFKNLVIPDADIEEWKEAQRVAYYDRFISSKIDSIQATHTHIKVLKEFGQYYSDDFIKNLLVTDDFKKPNLVGRLKAHLIHSKGFIFENANCNYSDYQNGKHTPLKQKNFLNSIEKKCGELANLFSQLLDDKLLFSGKRFSEVYNEMVENKEKNPNSCDSIIDAMELLQVIEKVAQHAQDASRAVRVNKNDALDAWVENMAFFWKENMTSPLSIPDYINGRYYGNVFETFKTILEHDDIPYTDKRLKTAMERAKKNLKI